jgi:hypothetical protein
MTRNEMRYLLRLDLDRVRRNLAATTTSVVTDDDVHRVLTQRGVWRHSDEWWGASQGSLAHFSAGEIVQKVPQQ